MGSKRDDELDRELQVHLDLEAEEQQTTGGDGRSSRAAARRVFGSVLKAKEDTRATWRGIWFERLVQDARYAIRSLRKTPGFTIVAILTFAIGIGANTAIFSIVNAVVIQPLSYPRSDRLVAIQETVRGRPGTIPVNAAHLLEWRKTTRAFEGIGILQGQRMNLTGSGEPESVPVGRASANIFEVLRVQPTLGRTFTRDEDELGRDRVVVLSDEIWRRRFGADARILGRTMSLNDDTYEIVGVLPESFHFPKIGQLYGMSIAAEQPEIWKPFGAQTEELDPGGNFNFACIARLRDGVSIAQARLDLQAAQRQVAEGMRTRPDMDATIVPLRDQITDRSRLGLELLLAAVGAVLLIGCVNIANLLFTRTAARRREIALRRALGASRGQLAQHMLLETLVLSASGGILALALAYAGIELLLASAPGDLPRLDEVRIDIPTLLFTATLSIVTGLLVGVLPVWRLTRADPKEATELTSTRSTAGRSHARVRSLFVVLEVGVCVICLLAGGLLLRSLVKILANDRGFDAQHVLTVDVNLPDRRYPTADARAAFVRSVIESLTPLPGLIAAGVSNHLPLDGEGGRGVLSVEGVTIPVIQRPIVDYRVVDDGYFRTLGIKAVAGRIFDESDRDRKVAVVSASAAARIWPGENPIGKRFQSAPVNPTLIEVVGVVSDVRSGSLDKTAPLTTYLPYWQATPPRVPPILSFAVRTAGEPKTVANAVRVVIQRLDRELPLPAFRTMDEVLDASVAQRRFQMDLVLLFAAAGVLLASLGIYGVVSYSVAQRTSEIGIRMALGARPAQIRGLIVRQGLMPVWLGLGLGVTAALAFGRVLGNLLYGVSPSDPLTIGLVALTLTVVAAAATYLPARRATRVDPIRALRTG